MAVVKKRNEQTESRLLLESDEPVELPPAAIEEGAVVLQFDAFRPHVPELLEALRAGTLAEPVPVMLDGSTFVVHGVTRSFWVKLWHSSPERDRVERAQIISCLPSTRGLQVIVGDAEEEFDEDSDDSDEDDFEGPEEFDDDDDDTELEGEDDDDGEGEDSPRQRND